MSQPQHPVANPFALLMDPQSIFRAIEKSERLERLHSRICRPLDKPLIPTLFNTTIREFDAAIDEEEFMDSGIETYAEAQPGLSAVH